MKGFQSSHNLDKVVPDLFLSELGPLLLVLLDGLQQISTVRELHDDAEAPFLVLKEGLLVADDVWMVDGSENSNFIDGILLFLF